MAHGIDIELLQTLGHVAELGASAHDPWHIFGGAAAALYGAAEIEAHIEAHDVDVLMSASDAKRVLTSHGISNSSDGGTDLFRSQVYGKLDTAPLPVDVLSGFEIKNAGVWVPVVFGNPVRIELSTGPVFVPQIAELIAVFRLCGRAKDLERADRLEALP